MLTGQNVLLTGGGSPIGQGLVPRILEQDPAVLRVFDSTESNLEDVMDRFDDDRLRHLLGRVRDVERLERAMEDIDVVIHTAGMRHADICEENPFEAVQTNVFGLQNVVETAIEADVQHVVFTSNVDPADPAYTLGATELLGEKLITEANQNDDNEGTQLVTVRLGQILYSSDSVIPQFVEQIRNGGPVTLSREGMSRFFYTHTDVFELISEAIRRGQGGEVFIYKMPAVWLEDLAEVLTDHLARQFGYKPTDIDLTYSDKPSNERSNEVIISEQEAARAYENDTLYVIPPEEYDISSVESQEEYRLGDEIIQSTEHASKIKKPELTDSVHHALPVSLRWNKTLNKR